MTRRHFETGGGAYARFRPSYPPALAAALADLAPARDLAVDVGCGTGQLSVLLADHFERVDAFDISADQVANATPHPGVRYAVAPADALPFAASAASLVTVAQAAHWFDLPRFYAEVRRIAAPSAILALIAYAKGEVDGPLAGRFQSFYADEVGEFWPPERALIENEYRDLPFPFMELDPPELAIERDWDLASLIGYVETWSATKRARAAGEGARVDAFIADAHRLWCDPDTTRRITWPVRIRLGRL